MYDNVYELQILFLARKCNMKISSLIIQYICTILLVFSSYI